MENVCFDIEHCILKSLNNSLKRELCGTYKIVIKEAVLLHYYIILANFQFR